MSNTYTQLHIHIVMAVKYRQALILPDFQERLYKYIIGIFHNHKHRVLAIGGVEDHIHILFGYDVNQLIPDLMMMVKRDSSKWINEQRLCPSKFSWQGGYGAFAVCKRHIDTVTNYILTQHEHHRKQTLIEEFVGMLETEELLFKREYIFHIPL